MTQDCRSWANEDTVAAMFAALEHGDLDRAASFWSDACLDRTAIEGAAPGRPGVRATLEFVYSAFPHARWTMHDVIATEHRVACRVVVTGYHRGEIYGAPPTGRYVHWRHIHMFRLEDGRIVEHDAVRDDTDLLQQLANLGTAKRHAPRSEKHVRAAPRFRGAQRWWP